MPMPKGQHAPVGLGVCMQRSMHAHECAGSARSLDPLIVSLRHRAISRTSTPGEKTERERARARERELGRERERENVCVCMRARARSCVYGCAHARMDGSIMHIACTVQMLIARLSLLSMRWRRRGNKKVKRNKTKKGSAGEDVRKQSGGWREVACRAQPPRVPTGFFFCSYFCFDSIFYWVLTFASADRIRSCGFLPGACS